mgnify:CR=1 FL=1
MSARELRLPPELHNVLVLISKQTGMTNQALIREAVTIWAFNIGAIKSVEDVPVTTYRYRARYNNKKKEIAP